MRYLLFRSISIVAVGLLGALVGLVLCPFETASVHAAQIANPKLIDAKELDGGTAWLNTDKPIKLADLKGRIVLLDFWTLC